MQTILLDDIVIPDDRQRREFLEADLLSLASSIRGPFGLLHPIVLREGRFLVAGERRLRAIELIYKAGDIFFHGKDFDGSPEWVPEGEVPYIDLGDLSELEAMEAELEENVRRVNLTFQDHALAVKKLHDLRVAQNPLHKITDTALEVSGRSDGDYQNNIRLQLIVAANLDNPTVAKAKSLKDAFKILKAEEERAKHIAAGEALPSEVIFSQHRVLQGDFRKQNYGKKFDVICTDPPYGMGADTFGDSGSGVGTLLHGDSGHTYSDSYEHWLSVIADFALFSYEITKDQAHLYAFCDLDRFHEFKALMEKAGWWVHRTPLIFQKEISTCRRVPWPEHGPRRTYELVLYAVKGKKPVRAIRPDIFTAKTDDNLGHPAQKPVGAWVELLSRSVSPGDDILDCFCGTGGIIPAAHSLKCIITAVDENPASYSIAVGRLRELKED